MKGTVFFRIENNEYTIKYDILFVMDIFHADTRVRVEGRAESP